MTLAWLSGWLNDPKSNSHGVLHRLLFEKWDGEWLVRDKFEELMYGFGVGLALVTAALLIIEVFVRRAGIRIPKRVIAGFGIGLTLLGFVGYFSFFNPNVRYVNYYHRHEFFHYYLGSKYFEELGYSRIYECTAVAEIELGRKEQIKNLEIRDLRAENLIKPMKDTYVLDDPEKCTSHFSTERWEEFKKDVKWMESASHGNYWKNMKKDHGYNPPPVWTMGGKLFSQLGPASDQTFKLLASFDVLMHIGILGALAWAFGWRVTAIASVFWGCNTAANFYWTGGAFLRQDWIFFLVLSLAFAKKKFFGLSGAAFIWSGLLRIFPLAAGFGWGAMIVLHWIRHKKLHPDHKRFIAGCAIAGGILVPSSMAVAGADSYREFAAHISLHKNTPLTNHMGLETMLVHTWDGRMRFTRDDSLNDPFQGWKNGRQERKAERMPLFILIWVGLMAWIVWALHRTKHFWIGLPLSVPLVMSLTNLTCYYYVIFILMAALVRVRPSVGPPLLATAAASQILLSHFYWIDDRYTALSYLYFACALVPLVAYTRPPLASRVRAWYTNLTRLWRRDSESRKPSAEPAAR